MQTPTSEVLMPENEIHSDRRSFLKKSLAIAVSAVIANSSIKPVFAQSTNKEADLFSRINRAEDPNKLQGLELGHVPQIMVPNSIHAGKPFEVEIRVGEKLHEMLPAHYIDWVDLYADDIFLAKFILTPNFTNPVCKVVLSLNASATLRAIEHCNLHGLWEGTKKITVLV